MWHSVVRVWVGEGESMGLLVPLPKSVLQGERSAQIRGILDILRRRRHEDLPQHRAHRSRRLVKASESVRRHGSGWKEPDLGRGLLVNVIVWRHCASTVWRRGWYRLWVIGFGFRARVWWCMCVPYRSQVYPAVAPTAAVGYEGEMEGGVWFSFV